MTTARQTLSAAQYGALLRDIKKLTLKAESAAAGEKVDAQWHIGKRIKQLRLSRDAGYHNTVIRDLAADTGLAISTLHQAVQFSEVYKKTPEHGGVSWSHYRVLLRVPKQSHRDFYVQKITTESWTSKQLSAAVTAGLHEGKSVGKDILKRPSHPHYLYSARVLDVIDGDTLDLSVDLGFGVYRELRVRLAILDCPELTTSKGREARDFVTQQVMSARTFAVQTVKADIYGRYVAHVFFAARKLTTLDCFKHGTYLNELLVHAKLATVIG